MRTLGVIMAVGGLLLAGYYALLYDTKETVGGSIGGASLELSVTDPDREDARKTGMMVGLGAVIGGGVMVALSSRKR
ncbi:MAG: hypothetical protein WD716_09415 [Fimbriimonadaceae bacterium]